MTRAEQKENRKNDILMNALELFVKKGYYDTKISDIAKSVNMSTGLLFHYFDSKESLYCELVKMGIEGTKQSAKLQEIPPEMFFEVFLKKLFDYASEQPWVFQMFVLMGQARRSGMPDEIRQLASSVDTIESSAEIIRLGQSTGIFRDGDPYMLSACFWSSVQGVMEQMAVSEQLKPDPQWLTSIIKK